MRVGGGSLEVAFNLLGLVLRRATVVMVGTSHVVVSSNDIRNHGLLHGRGRHHSGASNDCSERKCGGEGLHRVNLVLEIVYKSESRA